MLKTRRSSSQVKSAAIAAPAIPSNESRDINQVQADSGQVAPQDDYSTLLGKWCAGSY